MAVVEINLPHHRYEVRIEPGALSQLGQWVHQVAPHDRAAVLADSAVFDSYGSAAKQSLGKHYRHVTVQPLTSGEDHKNLDAVERLYSVLIDAKLERGSPVVALGGGVVGDTVGFAAATYLRGVPFIQCPTTLLAMVDASVGGKVGVNLPQGKNLVGSFYQPRLVVVDTDTLGTLPERELRCGLAECVKHAVIRDADLFTWIETHAADVLSLERDALVELVERNVRIKAAVVIADEKETGERAHLNFGHTFAHAIEAVVGYGVAQGYHHGEAVSLGMVAAAWLAVQTGRCSSEVPEKVTRLLDQIGLPTRVKGLPPTAGLMEAMQLDKKVSGGRLRLVLPTKLGEVSVVDDVGQDEVARAWETIRGSS